MMQSPKSPKAELDKIIKIPIKTNYLENGILLEERYQNMVMENVKLIKLVFEKRSKVSELAKKRNHLENVLQDGREDFKGDEKEWAKVKEDLLGALRSAEDAKKKASDEVQMMKEEKRVLEEKLACLEEKVSILLAQNEVWSLN